MATPELIVIPIPTTSPAAPRSRVQPQLAQRRAAGGAAIAATGSSEMLTGADPHLAWWDELQRIDCDPAPADVLARITELGNLIAETVPTMREGAAVVAKSLFRYQDELMSSYPELDYDAQAGRLAHFVQAMAAGRGHRSGLRGGRPWAKPRIFTTAEQHSLLLTFTRHFMDNQDWPRWADPGITSRPSIGRFLCPDHRRTRPESMVSPLGPDRGLDGECAEPCFTAVMASPMAGTSRSAVAIRSAAAWRRAVLIGIGISGILRGDGSAATI